MSESMEASPNKMDDELKTARSFNALYQRHGYSYKALDWGSREGQELRFQILSEIAPLDGTTILDVGCGFGHFYNWLSTQGIRLSYTGIDIADQIIQEAKRAHPEARFLVGSPSNLEFLRDERFDYVFASGIFSTYTSDPMEWMQSCIKRMWQWSRRGVAFNSLSAWALEPDPQEFYADPIAVLGGCKPLTSWISMRHDYHSRDFSVYLLRKGPQP